MKQLIATIILGIIYYFIFKASPACFYAVTAAAIVAGLGGIQQAIEDKNQIRWR